MSVDIFVDNFTCLKLSKILFITCQKTFILVKATAEEALHSQSRGAGIE